MARVHRIDVGTLSAPIRRADGTIIVEARFARTGVQTYRNADGTTRREYRSPEQVFSKASMDSFRLVPFTLGHPPVKVTAQNAREYSRGATGEDIRRDGKWMIGKIAVHDATAIAAMERGVLQVSNGYDCELTMTPGVSPDGERYDAVQTEIVGNHVALVSEARAGADAAVRFDAAYCDDPGDAPINPPKDTQRMDLTQALAALAAANEKIGALTVRADKAEQSATENKTRADKAEAERDAAKESAVKAETARKDAVDAAPLKIRARVELEGTARKVLGSRCDSAAGAAPLVDVGKLEDRALKLAVIEHVTGAKCDLDAAGKPRTDTYVDARYDAAIERASASADTYRATNATIEAHRADSGTTSTKRDSARDEMIAANRAVGAAPAAPAKK
jgi:hypothetical protein